MYLFYHSKRLYLLFTQLQGIAMPLSILGISWSFISFIYSMCVCVCVCVYIYIYIYIYIKYRFRHRHRFKSIDLAPVSKKTQTIPTLFIMVKHPWDQFKLVKWKFNVKVHSCLCCVQTSAQKTNACFTHTPLTDQSVHTARGCGPAVCSRSGAFQRSFQHRVYFCCAARAELKWQRFVHGTNEHGLTRKCSNFPINIYN